MGFCLVLAISAVGHWHTLRHIENYGDEDDWLTRSYFLRLAVVERDFGHFLWADRDGIDHPHMTDFVIGLGFMASGVPLPEVPVESRSWDDLPPAFGPRLRAGRAACALLGTAVAPMIFVIGVLASRRLTAGLVAGLLYAMHPLALDWQSRAMTEGPIMFFSVATLLALQLFVRATPVRDGRPGFGLPSVVAILACGFCAGAAVATKLNGLLPAVCPPVVLSLTFLSAFTRRGPGRWTRGAPWLVYLALFSGTMAATAVALNPTLYRSPIPRFRRMLQHRYATALRQQVEYPSVALRTLPERVDALFQALLWTHPEVPNRVFSIVHLNLAALGLWSLCSRLTLRPDAGERAEVLPLFVWTLVVAFVMTPMVLMNWPRYFLFHVVSWELLTGFGAAVVLDFARIRWRGATACDSLRLPLPGRESSS